MPAPFGFGVSDVVARGTLQWNVYQFCKFEPHADRQRAKQRAGKADPGSFDQISIEVLSLHTVLKEGEKTLFASPLPSDGLKVIGYVCDGALLDLQSLLNKYDRLGA